MKKCFVLILTFLMLCVLCSCDSSNTNKKVGVVSKEELMQYSEYVELTTENWDEFFEIKKETITTTDAFGEDTGSRIQTLIVLKDGCYISEDNAVRIKFNYEDFYGELYEMTTDIIFYDEMSFGEIVSTRGREVHSSLVGDLSCEKIKGTILKLSIPEEKWSLDSDGKKYITVEDGTNISTIYYSHYSNINYDTFV